MKELIEFIAASLVDDPTQVRVSQEQRGGKVYLKLKVAKEDMGRVIGRQGTCGKCHALAAQCVCLPSGQAGLPGC